MVETPRIRGVKVAPVLQRNGLIPPRHPSGRQGSRKQLQAGHVKGKGRFRRGCSGGRRPKPCATPPHTHARALLFLYMWRLPWLNVFLLYRILMLMFLLGIVEGCVDILHSMPRSGLRVGHGNGRKVICTSVNMLRLGMSRVQFGKQRCKSDQRGS